MDYLNAAEDLANTMALGYEVDASEDPTLGFSAPSQRELRWLASWIISEGWARTSGRPLVEITGEPS